MTTAKSWPPELVTQRLRLRPVAPGDAAPMTALANDLDLARMTTSIPHPFRVLEAEGFIARMQASDRAREALFAVDVPARGLAGVVGLHPNDQNAVELGYWLGRPFWGQGYLTEAARAVLAWVRDDWKRAHLVSGHFEDNTPSGAVLCKVGFLYTGERRQRFSLARGETATTRMMVWLA